MIAELKELILVVEQSHPNINQILGKNKAQATKMRRLYDGIIKGEYLTDNEATLKLYPEENKPNSYRKLKFSLREKLIDALFGLDSQTNSLNQYQRAYYECHKQWAAVKILLGKNADLSALNLALKLYKEAEYYEFTTVAMDMAAVMRLHYGIKAGNLEKYTSFSEAFDRLSVLYLLESKAEQLYLDLIISRVNSKEIKEREIELVRFNYEKINSLVAKNDSYRLQLYRSLIHLIYFTELQDLEKALAACHDFIAYFEAKDYVAHVPLQILYYQKLRCCFELNQFAEREELEEKCRQYLREGTYNWFRFKELLIRMALHQGDYTTAYRLYDYSTNMDRFSFLPDNVREVWTITAAYLYFLNITGALGEAQQKLKIKQFRVSKFLNETTLYSKDKRGMNIAIVIVQYLIILAEKKYSIAIDQLEGLGQYAYRHLKKPETQRSRNFIKMLLQIPISGFSAVEFEKKAASYLKRLTETPENQTQLKSEIEIVDYAQLWAILCRFYHQKTKI